MIICVPAGKGTLGYGEIREQTWNITDTVLAATLKELDDDSM